MKKRYKYRLPMDEDAAGGLAALTMAGISGLFLILSSLLSLFMGGKAGSFIGGFGVSGILLAAVGFWIGIRSFSEKKKNHRFSNIGSMLAGILFVLWIAVLLMGVS